MSGVHARPPVAIVLAWLSLGVAPIGAAAPPIAEVDRAIATGDYETARRRLDDELARSPDDAELRFRRATVLGYLGDYPAALSDYDVLRARYPVNVDYALGRARVLGWLGRDDEALAELREATRLAPDYEAVWELRFAIRSRQSGPQSKRQLEDLRRASAERFPKSRWWRDASADRIGPWTLFLGAGYDELSDSLPSWDNQFLELHWARTERDTHLLRFARDARFDEADKQVGFGTEWRLGSDWFTGADLGIASNPAFAPERALSGHIGKALDGGWAVDLRYRRREYATATVGSFIGTAEKYFGDFRAAYSFGVSHLHGASDSLSHTLHLNWYPSERMGVGISVATGDEAESVGPGQVLETEVRGLSVNGRHRLTNRVGINWWAGVHEQGDFYRRRYLGVAFSIRL